jgi:hypothetical protein
MAPFILHLRVAQKNEFYVPRERINGSNCRREWNGSETVKGSIPDSVKCLVLHRAQTDTWGRTRLVVNGNRGPKGCNGLHTLQRTKRLEMYPPPTHPHDVVPNYAQKQIYLNLPSINMQCL